MKVSDILSPGRTRTNAPGGSKKRVLEYIAAFISERDSSIDEQQLYTQLIARERLGSTGIGNGFAIPHCRLKDCDHISAVFLKLNGSIDFDAIDGESVDLVFALVVPEEQNEDHLQLLARIARIFQNPDNLKKMRNAQTDQDLYDALTRTDSDEGD